MYRYDVINKFVRDRFSPNCDYLEIGILDPSECYDRVIADRKHSIDPGNEFEKNHADFKMTSDEFFENLNYGQLKFNKDFKWDIIFIDGLHISEQSLKDILNSLEHIKDDGVIVVHDCNPPDWKHAHSDYEHYIENNPYAWNGTVWKSFYFARTFLDHLTYTVDFDYGIGVIDKKNVGSRIQHDNIFFDYGKMIKNRKHYLGLISVDEFMQKDLS